MVTKAAGIEQVKMPDVFFHNVKDLFLETQMSSLEFRIFARTVRFNAIKYLDSTGVVPIEEQDPAALRRVLDQVKKYDPTISKRYPHLWPVLAYLELYLWGKHRESARRDPRVAINRPVWMSRPGAISDSPIYKRFARSKAGKSLREISEKHRSFPVSQSTRSKKNLSQSMAKRPYKKKSTTADSKAAERATARVDSTACTCSAFTTHVKDWFQSFGSYIEEICTHFIGG